MEVYIEYVLIDNMVINYLIIVLSLKMLKLEQKVYRILLASAVGTLFAFVMPLINLSGVLLFIFKMLVGLIIVLFVLNKQQLKRLMRFYLTFLMFTFVMGGVCFAFIYVLAGEVSGTTYSLDVPVGLLLLIVVLWTRYVLKLIKAIQKRHTQTYYIYEINLTLRKKNIKINAYFDTGNLLVDVSTSKPIIIVNFAKVIDDFNNDEIRAVLTGNTSKLDFDDVHFEEFKAMSTSGKMIVLKPKSVVINELNKDLTKEVMVALSVKPLTKEGGFDALIGPKVLSGG